MGIRLSRTQIIRVPWLYDMEYRPVEIAKEIGVTTETVVRTYIPGGAPFERDKAGHLWINGVQFAGWVQEVFKKRKKISLEEGEGWCCKCNRAVKMTGPRQRYANAYMKILQGHCEGCGGKVNRCYSNRGKKTSPLPSPKGEGEESKEAQP